MRDYITPLIAILVGTATGIYTFQPLILEQLKKDNNLNPKYDTDEQLAKRVFGDLTTNANSSDTKKNGSSTVEESKK